MKIIRQIHRTGSKAKALIAFEVAVIFSAFVISSAGGDLLDVGSWSRFQSELNTILSSAFVFTVPCFMMMMGLGLYSTDRPTVAQHALSSILAIVLSLTTGALALYALSANTSFFRFEGNIVVFSSVVSLLTILYCRIFKGQFWQTPSYALILGAGCAAANLATQIRQYEKSYPVLIKGYIALPGQNIAVPGAAVFELDNGLLQIAMSLHINEIVVAVDRSRIEHGIQQLLDCKLAGIRITSKDGLVARMQQGNPAVANRLVT